MGARGAQFDDLNPRDSTGTLAVATDPGLITLPSASGASGINNSLIAQVTPNNAFRLGQQIIFWVGIFNPDEGGGAYLQQLRLKPWWARNNMEFRQAGAQTGQYAAPGSYLPIDSQVFLGDGLSDNRYIWMPSPKRLDVTPYAVGPSPGASNLLTSDSEMLDDVWKWDLDDPTDAAYADRFQTGQIPSRWSVFMYPAMGYALGFTYEADFTSGEFPVTISLSWTIGTLGASNYQESIG